MTLASTATINDIITMLQGLTGINQKADLVSAMGSPWISSDTMAALIAGLQTDKTNLATNLAAKGSTAAGTESLDSLVTKVGNLSGKRWASGTLSTNATGVAQVTGLSFQPSFIIIEATALSPIYRNVYKLGYDATINAETYNSGSQAFASGTWTITASGFSVTINTNNSWQWTAYE